MVDARIRCHAQLTEVDGALTAAEQFVWGGAEAAPVAELVASLRRARRWASRVSAATKTKPTMELLRPLLAVDPPPMQHPGVLPRLTSPSESYHHLFYHRIDDDNNVMPAWTETIA